MLVGPILAILLGFILWWVLSLAGELRKDSPLPKMIMGGYLLRIGLQFFIREIPFFSHGAGGDSYLYEEFGRLMAKLWRAGGIHYITVDDGFNIGATSLPQNLFALIIYLNDGEKTRLGCTAVVAFAAALTALNIYSLALEFGAERKNALLMAGIIYFEPAFLFYTCDLYKDGLVLCIAFGALGSALRLSRRPSILHALVGAVSLYALWYVRFYLIFVTIAPLLVGIAGLGSKKLTRPVIAALALATAAFALASFTDILQLGIEKASDTFAQATSERSIRGNNKGEQGSGVVFDDGGSATGLLPLKLAYTIFSPFPWAGGSLGFQFGKIDGFIFYFIIYRAIRALRTADRRLVVMLFTFIVPSTLMYAMTMANVGLIVRQRLIIVASLSILAALYTPKKVEKAAELEGPKQERLKAGRRRPATAAAARIRALRDQRAKSS